MKNEYQNPITTPDWRDERLAAIKHLYPDLFTDEGKINPVEIEALASDGHISLGEKFEFRWPGKMQAKRHAFTSSKARLAPDTDRSVNFDETKNVIIEGENLEVLKLLSKAYYNKVKCIYIDPPYNTGHDFVYSDDYSEGKQAYWEKNGVFHDGVKVDTNSESAGRYHTNWLNMMMPRLLLAQMMLKNDGVIFVSIDDNEVHNLRKLMDEVFGEENFVADVVVVNNLKGRNDKRYIATAHERLLMYVKSEEFAESGLRLPETRIDEFDQSDDAGKYRFLGLRKRGGADTRVQRPKMYFPIYVDSDTGLVSLERDAKHQVEVFPMKSDGTEGCWRWGRTTVAKDLTGLIGKPVGGTSRYDIFEKDYLETDGEMRRIKPKSVMYSKEYSTDAATKAFRQLFPEAGFDNPKSVVLIKDLIDYSTTKGGEDIILDFFAGSGTTGHAAMELNKEDGGNRRFVIAQLPEATDQDSKAYKSGFEKISAITIERVRRAAQKIKAEKTSIDTGFKVFKLTTSIFPENTYQPDPEKSAEENVRALKEHIARAKQQLMFDPKGKETDLMYETLIKQGFMLTMTKEHLKEFAENEVWKVTDGDRSAIVCLDAELKDATVKTLAEYKDNRFIGLHRAVDTTKKWELTQTFGEALVLI